MKPSITLAFVSSKKEVSTVLKGLDLIQRKEYIAVYLDILDADILVAIKQHRNGDAILKMAQMEMLEDYILELDRQISAQGVYSL